MHVIGPLRLTSKRIAYVHLSLLLLNTVSSLLVIFIRGSMSVISLLASVGMAVGPPCVYLDQYFSIIKRKDSTGFSIDVCGVLVSRTYSIMEESGD